METQYIYNHFNEELYFFILKKVKNKNIANDVFQNIFLKIHKNLAQLKSEEKIRSWIFRIARNEITNYYNKESKYLPTTDQESINPNYQDICCFDKFIDDLPPIYKEVIELIYIDGRKQKVIAKSLDISLENVKARTSRAKDILKKKFMLCCKYELDKNGNLKGESNCSACEL
jgi:RNA polymerase sigma-70 factor (ECF subfamily)